MGAETLTKPNWTGQNWTSNEKNVSRQKVCVAPRRKMLETCEKFFPLQNAELGRLLFNP